MVSNGAAGWVTDSKVVTGWGFGEEEERESQEEEVTGFFTVTTVEGMIALGFAGGKTTKDLFFLDSAADQKER